MAIAIDTSEKTAFASDRLSGALRSNFIDRWIYVFTAAMLIAIVLTGFIPDSFAKIAAIDAGKVPASPLILHVHAVLMGSFLLLLLAQTVVVATDKRKWHMQLGIAATVLVPAIVVSGIILAPTMYHSAWNTALTAPPAAKMQIQRALSVVDNIQLLQFRAGFLFVLFVWIALRARTRDAGLHKRMILLSVTTVIGAAIARIHWLPTTMPASPATLDLFAWLSLAPMFIWDLVRNRRLHRAYLIWAALYLPATAVVYSLWNTPWWHATAHHIMGV